MCIEQTGKEVDHGKSQVSHLKKNTINFLSKILNRFVLKNDGLIIYSYLPHKENAKLEFALGQCPQIWRTNWPVFSQKINKSARANLTSKFLTEFITS